jgi:hypothetical protein
VSSGSARGGRLKGLAFATLAVALAALAVLALTEIGLRVYHWRKAARQQSALPPVAERCLVPSEDKELVFELNPGWSEAGFSVNSLGMADEELAASKPEGSYRIAFFGDSISCNFRHRPRDEIYLEVLEDDLDAPERRIECLNFGVNGYGMRQSVRLAETRLPGIDVDAVVLQLCLNDPHASESDYGTSLPEPWLRSRDFLWRRVRPARFWAYRLVERAYDRRGEENLRESFRRLASLAREHEVPAVAVLFPYLYRPAYGE